MAATINYPRPRCSFDKLTVLSMHVDHRYAHKKFAAGAISGLLEHLKDSGIDVDIVCGDLNATRCRGVSNVSQCHTVTVSRAPTPVRRSKSVSNSVLSFLPPPGWGQHSAGSERGLSGNWSELTLDALEQCCFVPAADWNKEPVTQFFVKLSVSDSVCVIGRSSGQRFLPLVCLGLLLLRAARGAVRALRSAWLLVGTPLGCDG